MTPTIITQLGDRGTKVRIVQRLLKLYVDGIYGPLTEEAVREFQEMKGLPSTGKVDRMTWERLLGYCLVPTNRSIREIIVHCSATPEGKDYTVADITRWHRQRGYSTIGYHYVIYRDGSIHQGRDINVAGAHCQGHNTGSIGVCYIGGMTSDNKRARDTRTAAQRNALLRLLKDLRTLYPNARIYGHRDFSNKECPCFDAKREYSSLV